MSGAEDLPCESTFAGRYRILRRIASGGMGAVYEVVHIETDRRRALKVMHANLFQSEEWRERFKREAKVAAQIDSEYIVDVFDAGIDEPTGIPFLVMELLRGEELGERLKREGKLAPPEALGYLHQIALALEKTHQASIVHRDLKPANIYLVERSEGVRQVKILDFGIAKMVADGATAGGSTQSLGTPQYMAPEQLNPHAKLSSAADIYALGMMTYTLLVGCAYWIEEARGGNVLALLAVASHGPVEKATIRAARYGATLPPAFDSWFAQATARIPANRFPSAMEAIAALTKVFSESAETAVITRRMPEPTTKDSSLDLQLEQPLDQVTARSNVPEQATVVMHAPTTPPKPPLLSRDTHKLVGAFVLIACGLAGLFQITQTSAKSNPGLETAPTATPSATSEPAPTTLKENVIPPSEGNPMTINPAKLETPELHGTAKKSSGSESLPRKPQPKPASSGTNIHTWDPE